MIILLCDHCGIDYTTCTCLAGIPDVLPAPLPPLTSEADDFELTPLDSRSHVDTSDEEMGFAEEDIDLSDGPWRASDFYDHE
jgi:hypothetical protein